MSVNNKVVAAFMVKANPGERNDFKLTPQEHKSIHREYMNGHRRYYKAAVDHAKNGRIEDVKHNMKKAGYQLRMAATHKALSKK